jgi:hypothetical protein
MDLGSKLKRIVSQIEQKQKAQTPSVSIDEIIEGDWITTVGKKVFAKTNWRTWKNPTSKLEKLFMLQKIQDNPDIKDILFIDTETTGLAGGTGTYAFMVGLGFLNGEQFQTVQLFMPGFADEPALLSVLSDYTLQYKCLASFNGKTFDIPLLQTRYQMIGAKDPFNGKPHVDLLHPSRAIWKKRLSSCSLQSIESHIFNLVREGDIPGEMIPEIYFNYVRKGDATLIDKVFFHNEQDIVSMMTLINVVGSVFDNPDSQHFNEPIEQLCVGKYLANKGFINDGLAYCARAKDTTNKNMRDEASFTLGSLYKKIGDIDGAIFHYGDVEQNGTKKIDALIEQAKHFEHKARDCQKALEFTTKAIGLIRDIELLEGGIRIDDTKIALIHRQDRLLKKISKNGYL